MRKNISLKIMSLAAAFVFSAGLLAQEKTEVTIQVKKDGKVVEDTTYEFEDAEEAKHVLKMVEIMSEEDGEHVIHKHGEHVMVMKKGDGDSFNVWVDEDGDTKVMKKQVKVVVSGDEKGTWTAVSADGKDVDEEEIVYFISEEDDMKVEIRKVLEETGDGEKVKVIVIKKEKDEDCEHDEDHDEDHDHDEEVDVDVKVIKKKVKKQEQ